MLISNRNQQDSGETPEKFSPWSAYSDMYCALLLIFMLLFFFVILQYLQLKDENDEATRIIQNELSVRLSDQDKLNEELEASKKEIERVAANAESQRQELENEKKYHNGQQGKAHLPKVFRDSAQIPVAQSYRIGIGRNAAFHHPGMRG